MLRGNNRKTMETNKDITVGAASKESSDRPSAHKKQVDNKMEIKCF